MGTGVVQLVCNLQPQASCTARDHDDLIPHVESVEGAQFWKRSR